MSQRGYTPLDTRLLLLEAAGCPLEHSKGWATLKSNLCFSMVASLCFGQTKTNQLYAQINSMSKSLFNLRLVVTILSCSRGGMSIEEKLVSLSL